MKHLIFLAPIIVLLFACKNTNHTSDGSSNDAAKDSTIVENAAKVDFKDLSQQVGKLPKEIDLFQKYGLYARIEKIMGKDFAEFKAEWNEETPLQKDGEIMYTTGCKAGACKSNKYILVLDISQNSINVHNYKYDHGRSFEEDHTIIGMPYKMADEFDKIRKEQGL
ncbi:MAG: hypothetical protein IPO92_05600 [Saprospiraceae bacterium]|nr:hypothetical protein [Saprospiraceae bacterium]